MVRSRIGALVAACCLIIVGVPVAAAADQSVGTQIPVEFSSGKLSDWNNGDPIGEDSVIEVGQPLRLAAQWTLPPGALPGDYFDIAAEDGLKFFVPGSGEFDLISSEAETVATCVYDGGRTSLRCTILSPLDEVSGTTDVALTYTTAVLSKDPGLTVGHQRLALPAHGPVVSTNHAPDPVVSGTIDPNEAVIHWIVAVPADSKQVMVTTDAANQTLIGQPALLSTRIIGGKFNPYEFLPDSSASMTSESTGCLEGAPACTGFAAEIADTDSTRMYGIAFSTRINAGAVSQGQEFTVEVQVDAEVLRGTVTAQSDGPSAGNCFTFTVAKQLPEALSDSIDFDYFLVEASAEDDEPRHILVPPDGTPATSPCFPNGTTISLAEVLPEIPGVSWNKPRFSPSDTITGPTDVTVTNSGNYAQPDGTFEITNTIEGPQTAIQMVGTSPFTISYTVDGEKQAPLSVAAGTAVSGPALPDGATVEFSATPPSVAGVTFTTPQFSASPVTIGSGTTTEVALTTTVRSESQPPPNPKDPPDGGFFSIQSQLDDADLTEATAGNAVFTVAYTVDGIEAPEPLRVLPGETVTSPRLPAGSSVRLTKVTETASEVNFGVSVLSENDLTIEAGTTSRVVLTSHIIDKPDDKGSGSFTLAKRVQGTNAAVDAVADMEFTVEYSVNGIEAQTPLTVSAGGQVAAPSFPEGTLITLREVAPSREGVIFGSGVFSQSSFTISANAPHVIDLVNPVRLGDATTVSGAIPSTKLSPVAVIAMIAGGVALIVLIGVSVWMVRRNRSDT